MSRRSAQSLPRGRIPARQLVLDREASTGQQAWTTILKGGHRPLRQLGPSASLREPRPFAPITAKAG